VSMLLWLHNLFETPHTRPKAYTAETPHTLYIPHT
jgi:hypothetical protein